MDELDKRLRTIIQGDILGGWAVAEIKRAFIDAGWLSPEKIAEPQEDEQLPEKEVR